MANQILADDDLDQALDALDVERNFLDEDVEKETEPPEQPNNRADESTGLLVDGGTPVECEDDISVEDGGSSPLLVALALVIAVVVVVVAVIVSIPFWILVLVLLVVLFVAARTRIPPPASFHAKKEIKRIKRGKHLPQNNSNNNNNTDSQKKTWLGKKVTTVKTFLSGEAKDAVGAYDDILFCDVGIGMLVVARDLTNGECFTWLGFLGQWRVLDLSPETQAKLHQWLWKSSMQ